MSFSADPSVDVTKFLEGISYYEVIGPEKTPSSATKMSTNVTSTPNQPNTVKSNKSHKQTLLSFAATPSVTKSAVATTTTTTPTKDKCQSDVVGSTPNQSKSSVGSGNAVGKKVAMCCQCNGMSSNLQRCTHCGVTLPADALVLDSMVDGEGFRRGGALLVSAVPNTTDSPGPVAEPRRYPTVSGSHGSTPVRVKHSPLRPRSPMVSGQRGSWMGPRHGVGPLAGPPAVGARMNPVPVRSFYHSKSGPVRGSFSARPGTPVRQRLATPIPRHSKPLLATPPSLNSHTSLVNYPDSDSMDVDEDSDDQQQTRKDSVDESGGEKQQKDQASVNPAVRRRYSVTEYQQMSRPSPSHSQPSSAPPTGSTPSSFTERPCFISGKMAICGECGAYSRNLVRCACCRQPLAADAPHIDTTQGGESFIRGGATAATPTALGSVKLTLPTSANLNTASPPIVRKTSQVQSNQQNARAAQRRLQEEPECLTISSDEEEEEGEGAESRETSIASNLLTLGDFGSGGGGESTSTPTKNNNNSSTSALATPVATPPVSCGNNGTPCTPVDSSTCRGISVVVRTVRVGSHRCIPADPVFFSDDGCRFRLPTVGVAPRLVIVAVPCRDITNAQVHLGQQLAALFLSVGEQLAAAIRQQLGMAATAGKTQIDDSSGSVGQTESTAAPALPDEPYFDPNSANEQCRRLTVIFEDPMSPECKKSLLSILRALGPERLQEISSDETNAILLRCSPFSNAVSLHTFFSSGVSNTLFQYPPAPSAGSIVVTMDDYMCLEEEQFLNDIVIDFYLKYLVNGRISPEDRLRTHVFSSFFYQRLTTRPRRHLVRKPPTTPSLSSPAVTGSGDGVESSSSSSADTGATSSTNGSSAAQKRHARVKGWTKNVDIFDKDFLLVPINEHSHWFLAIVCFPGLVGYRRLLTDEPCAPPPLLPHPPRGLLRSKLPADGSTSATNIPFLPTVPGASTHSTESGTVVLKIGSTLVMPVGEPTAITRPHASPPSLDLPDSDRDEAEPDEDEEAELAPTVPELVPADGSQPSGPAPENDDSTIEGDEELDEGDDNACPLIEPIPPIDYSQADRQAVKQPCILILDSLAGPSRSRVVATLRDYLRVEYAVRKSSTSQNDSVPPRVFDKNSLRGCSVRVPQQDNYTDCGLYVLQYAESFFQFPLMNFRLPLPSLTTDWFPSWRVLNKRRHLSALMRHLSDQQRTRATSTGGPQTPSSKRPGPGTPCDSTVKSAKH